MSLAVAEEVLIFAIHSNDQRQLQTIIDGGEYFTWSEHFKSELIKVGR